ncbi:unnamed protein product [Phytophthora fragariaefolia]|uniref:Unnamed protein product n=1 Tax=Phytophthora fragariaefolia TaxID=1490495 RepID=A0A9W6YBQ5_9STRA|nr:unnamed protein product [Phytophthora fragariaefolia]
MAPALRNPPLSSEKSQDDNMLAIPHEIKHAIKAEAAPTKQDWVRTKGGSSSKREKAACQSPDQQGIYHEARGR